ncbi:MAG: hypothetical protein AAGG72_04510 [Pseudomonadota bacterium]
MARRELAEFEIGESGNLAGAVTAEQLFQLGLRAVCCKSSEPDRVAAHKWFNLACLKGHESARTLRTEVAAEMNRRDIARAQAQARQWLHG